MERLQVDDVLLQTLVTLINLGARKAGLASAARRAGPAAATSSRPARRSTAPARCSPLLEPRHGEELGPIKDALSRLQMAYVQLSGGNAAGRGSPSRKSPSGPGPAQIVRAPLGPGRSSRPR